MRKRRLLKRTFSFLVAVNFLSLFLVTWYANTLFRNFFIRSTVDELDASTSLIMANLTSQIDNGDLEGVNATVKRLAVRSRITVVLEDGRVIGDSHYPIDRMENHLERPEIQQALNEGKGDTTRYSQTLDRNLIYFARAYAYDEGVMIIRVAQAIDMVDTTLSDIRIKIAIAWLVASLVTSFVIFKFASWLSRPLEDLRKDIDRFANGQYQGSLPVSHWEEIGGLAVAMNKMATRLDERTVTIHRQRMEVDAILASMNEAVMAIDTEATILKLNQAMADLFDIDVNRSRGRKVPEIIRNREFNRFIRRALSQPGHVSGDMTLYGSDTKYLLANATRLRGLDGKTIGAVIVLNNISDIKRLENLRRDFVANVSHELRTPITSIKGFVETLINEAVDDPDDARHFLRIIARQTERLSQIIEDLLSLSRIEQGKEEIKADMELCAVDTIIDNVMITARERAQAKGMKIQIECEEDLYATVHPNLFEQAVLNLVDNAIKYSEADKSVWIRTSSMESEKVRIDISDEGRGIPSSHIPRLFERFYRVDTARSRDVGGTGLGLSIVKHIVQAHNGVVEVESEVDEGSTFSIIIPTKQPNLAKAS